MNLIEFQDLTVELKKCVLQKHTNKNGRLRSSRIGPGDEMEPGHVAVMALPARHAAELFLAMYRYLVGVLYIALRQWFINCYKNVSNSICLYL